MIECSTAVLAVANVPSAAKFYVDVLGFTQRWLWGDPPTFGCVGIGRVEVFLCEQPELARQVEGHMHCFFSDADTDIDALHARHAAAGANIISPIENKPWGLREYTVRDPSGYHLRFGGHPAYERPKSATGSLPEHVRIEVALPSDEEHIALFKSVNWQPHPHMRQTLEQSMFCAMARDARDGRALGMTRVTGDGRQFMIWDVIVRQEVQGQRIGSALVNAALAELRRRGAPQGAFVGLFTPKPGFYERIGFHRSLGMNLSL
jgi:uncharacterized glyoxalase superfamily protein PhnB/GNAT superfamily N-acetyltransferase